MRFINSCLCIALVMISGSAAAGKLSDLFGDDELKSRCLDMEFGQYDYLAIGLGVAKSLEKASDLAISDIAKQLRVDIKNEEFMSSSTTGLKVNSNYSSSTNITSDIKGLKGAKRECWDPNASNNRHVVVYSYDTRSIYSKVANWLNTQGKSIGSNTEFVGPSVIKNSLFINKVKSLTQVNKESIERLSISLIFNNNAWELMVNGKLFLLIETDLFDLIGSQLEPSIQLVTFNSASEKYELVRRLEHNQEFKFAFKQDGYRFVSVFNLLQDGRVTELLSNESVDQNKLIPADIELNFQAYVESGDSLAQDIYVLLFSKQLLPQHNFRKLELNESVGSDQYAYTVDQFLDWVDGQAAKMSILQTTVFR